MSIVRVDSYELRCDECNTRFEQDEICIWCNDGDALDSAADFDWVTYRKDGRHFCPTCAARIGLENDA